LPCRVFTLTLRSPANVPGPIDAVSESPILTPDRRVVATSLAGVLRMSTLFVRTLRDDPVDAEVPSHKLLVRAGYIRRVAPGIYTWLPLGWKVLRNVERIVREEMDAMGAQEVHFPALLPREPYERTGRWVDYGDDLFRLQDRRKNEYLLGPTHEEMFTLLVKDLYSSYKDLPLSLYQIQNKYRDETRPRAGILRGREFLMKDSYSFDMDEAGLQASYDQHRASYIKTFARLGLEVVIVSATSGAMGGSASEEFINPCAVGEDTFIQCLSCGLAANVEAVKVVPPAAIPLAGLASAHIEETPDTPTIETLVAVLNEKFPRADRKWTAADTLKNLIVTLAHPDGTKETLAIGVPGDRDVDMKRLEAQISPAVVEPFTEEDFAKNPELIRGYIGPTGLGENSASKVRYLVDPRIVEGSAWVTGANVKGRHVIDLVAGRDFTADGTIEAAEVKADDPCPNCGGALSMAKGLEVAHIFQLGRKFAKALELTVLDQNGKTQVVTMGSYGIGVSRAVAAVAEQTHDEFGLCWPRAIAPAQVHIVAMGKENKDLEVFAESTRIADALEAAGIDILFDDRSVSPGIKHKDAELLGMPTIVIIGKSFTEGAIIEVKDRKTGEEAKVPAAEIVAHLISAVRG
jgi:prolyl-tRNA synthetase